MAGLLPSGARRFGALLLGNGIMTGSALANLISQVVWDRDVQGVRGDRTSGKDEFEVWIELRDRAWVTIREGVPNCVAAELEQEMDFLFRDAECSNRNY